MSSAVAWALVIPSMLGTRPLPVATVRVTVSVTGISVPPRGVTSRTVPFLASTGSSVASTDAPVSPAAVSTLSAASASMPTRSSGIVFISGPALMVSTTSDPSGTSAPPAGLVRITWPTVAASGVCSCSILGTRFASRTVWLATASVLFSRPEGTVTSRTAGS